MGIEIAEQIKTSANNGVFEIQINRPETKNALSLAMYQSLVDALHTFESDDDLKVALIYGSEQCFSAGNDLSDFLSGGVLDEQHPTVKFLYALNNLKKPLVAAVAGPAIGIGTTMLMHCDMVFAADNSLFQLPFAQLGLCPEAASSLLLAQKIGHQKAFEYLVLGHKFDANKAEQFDLINSVTTAADLLETARSNANQIAQLSSDAVASTKLLLKKANQDLVVETIKLELAYFETLLNSEYTKSVIQKFFKK